MNGAAEIKTSTRLIVFFLILIGALYRWPMLDLRPLHHDESIHVMFGKYFFDNPDQGFYKYDPEYHGPLLYTVLRFAYKSFGDTETTARGVIAFLGTCMLFLPYLCRKYLSDTALIFLTAALAISPTAIFWSRFVREDMFVFTGMALVLYGVLAAPNPLKSFFVLLGVVFQYASKENSYVTLALFWAYCVFEFLWRRIVEVKNEPVPCTLFAPLPFASVIILHLGMTMKGTSYQMIDYNPMHLGAMIGAFLIGLDIFRDCWEDVDESNSLIVRTFGWISKQDVQPLFNPSVRSKVTSIILFGLFFLVTRFVYINLLIAAFLQLSVSTQVAVGDYLFSSWAKYIETALITAGFFYATRGTLYHRRIYLIVSFLLAGGLFWYLFSAAGRYPSGVLDGLYQKGITYWMEKHGVERIKGPFLFPFYMMSWYEFFFVLAIFVHAVHFCCSRGKIFRIAGICIFVLALLIGFSNIPADAVAWHEPEFFLAKFFKLKDWLDITGVTLIVAYPAIVTLGHARDREWNLCFWGYWFTATFFTYSYLGEKVPWLSEYGYFAGILYFALYWMDVAKRMDIREFPRIIANLIANFAFLIIGSSSVFMLFYYFKTKTPTNSLLHDYSQLLSQGGACIVFGLLLLLCYQLQVKTKAFSGRSALWGLFLVYCIFNMRIAYLVNFIPEKMELGYISQVHTTSELVNYAKKARAEGEKPNGEKDHRIMVTGDSAWPLVWYFRNLPAYSFSPNGENKSHFYYIFQDTGDKTPPEFVRKEISLRGWWVPDFREITLFHFLNMSFNLEPWGGFGYSNIAYLEKKAS